jgi:hypothetical protein
VAIDEEDVVIVDKTDDAPKRSPEAAPTHETAMLLNLSPELLCYVTASVQLPRDLCAFAASCALLHDSAREALVAVRHTFLEARVEPLLEKVGSSRDEIRCAMRLNWTSKGVTAADCAVMAHIFHSSGALVNLTTLDLRENKIGDAGMVSLAGALSRGALANIESLNLHSNKIGDAGMAALANALSSGALGNLQELIIGVNKIGDGGMAALVGALVSGALDNLQALSLVRNQIGDRGMKAFAGALSSGVLDKLTYLSLDSNDIGDAGMAALAGAISSGALPGCMWMSISVCGNPANQEALQAVEELLKRRVS